MNTPTLEQVYSAAQQLPLADQQLLAELREPPKTTRLDGSTKPAKTAAKKAGN